MPPDAPTRKPALDPPKTLDQPQAKLNLGPGRQAPLRYHMLHEFRRDYFSSEN
jgi:hypothetical protein